MGKIVLPQYFKDFTVRRKLSLNQDEIKKLEFGLGRSINEELKDAIEWALWPLTESDFRPVHSKEAKKIIKDIERHTNKLINLMEILETSAFPSPGHSARMILADKGLDLQNGRDQDGKLVYQFRWRTGELKEVLQKMALRLPKEAGMGRRSRGRKSDIRLEEAVFRLIYLFKLNHIEIPEIKTDTYGEKQSKFWEMIVGIADRYRQAHNIVSQGSTNSMDTVRRMLERSVKRVEQAQGKI